MAVLPPASNPREAIKDLWAFIKRRDREQIWGLTMAVLVTTIILLVFTIDPKVNTAPPATVLFVENYGPDRTDADIIAEQKRDSEMRHKLNEEKKRQFRELQDKLGIE